MHKLFIIAMLMCLAACSNKQASEDHANAMATWNHDKQQEALTDLVYLKDHRSGLCFSYVWQGHSPTMSNVPCDQVESLLKNP